MCLLLHYLTSLLWHFGCFNQSSYLGCCVDQLCCFDRHTAQRVHFSNQFWKLTVCVLSVQAHQLALKSVSRHARHPRHLSLALGDNGVCLCDSNSSEGPRPFAGSYLKLWLSLFSLTCIFSSPSLCPCCMATTAALFT